MAMPGKRARPRNLNLFSIRLPVSALVSVLHRVSGFVLFLVLPGLLLCIQWSLQSAEGFARVQGLLTHPLAKLMLSGLLWAFFHHFLAGLRHLAMDFHWGASPAHARITSRLVLLNGLLLTLWVAVTIC